MAEVKNTHKRNIYLYFGDEFLVQEQVRELVNSTLNTTLIKTNYTVIDGSSLDLSHLISEVRTPSLFGGARVILVQEVPLFMGKFEKGKILKKLVDSWSEKNVDRALQYFGQLLSWAGIDKKKIENDGSWIEDIADNLDDTEEQTVLRTVGKAFLESGKSVKTSDEEAIIEQLLMKELPSDTFLIFTAERVDRRKKIFKTLKKQGQVIECQVKQERFGKNVERSYFETRIREILNREGKAISRDGLDAVYSRTGANMRRLNSELNKLVQYIGNSKEITRQDVEHLFGDFYEAAFYELNAALRTRDLSTCLKALHEHRKVAEHPLQSLAMVANEFRKLMVARELLFTVFRPYWKSGMTYKVFQTVLKQIREDHPEIAGKGKNQIMSMKDYPIFLYVKDAQQFTMDKLADIMNEILEADIMLKSSKIARNSSNTIMEQLIFKICLS